MEGWFAVSRKLLDSPEWTAEPFTRGQAWVDLVGLARWEPGEISVRGVRVKLGRGQLAWSVANLAKRWRWSPGKVKRQLMDWQNGQRIDRQESRVTSITTITNYNAYQSGGPTDGSTERPTDGPRKNKETKNKGRPGTTGSEMRRERRLSPLPPPDRMAAWKFLSSLTRRGNRQDAEDAWKWVGCAVVFGEAWLANIREGVVTTNPRNPMAVAWTIAREGKAEGEVESAMARVPRAPPDWPKTEAELTRREVQEVALTRSLNRTL